MSISLFRRWRSQKFSDLVGQESVVSTLQNVLKAGSPARAYLFCGPRGTGKTSSARIFAKALNCENGPAAEPCNECTQCRSIADGNNLDVFEIDAASHTQVDKIRDFIVEKVHFTPVSARYKVYIIDEVHKLSTSSFNALLKTLEEPPSHVVFILATTHPHEMPSTILSRCQRYDFRPITASEAEKHLLMIAEKEEIDLEEPAARQLARAADGSLRDALVLFEQANVFAEGKVTRESVLDLLGGVGYEVLEEMFTDLERGDAAAALQRLDSWIVRGRDLKRLAESFQDHLRMMLLLKVRTEDQSIRHLVEEERASLDRLTALVSVGAITQWLRAVGVMLSKIRDGRQARLEWEMLLVGLAIPETDPSVEGLERRLERLEAGGGTGARPESASAPGSAVPAALVERLERLEATVRSVSERSDDDRLSHLERELARLANLDRPIAKSESEPERSPEPLAEPARAEPVAERQPEPVTESVATAVPVADPARVAEPVAESVAESVRAPEPVADPVSVGAEGALVRDIVDDWLVMPDVLVTGRIDATAKPTAKAAAVAPEPEPAPAPKSAAPERRAPEPVAEPVRRAPEVVAEPVRRDPEPEPERRAPEPVAEPVRRTPEPVAEPERRAPEPVAEPERRAPELAPRLEMRAQQHGHEPPSREPVPVREPAPEPVGTAPLPESKEFFRLLMQKVREHDMRLHAVLADARLVYLDNESFELAVPPGYEWHFNMIREKRAFLEGIVKEIAPGHALQMQSSIGGEKAPPPKENEHEELVKRASGVFGGSSIID